VNPIVVTPLPYQVSGNTASFGDYIDGPQGTQCGTTPPNTNYLSGNDVFYSYTADFSGTITVTLTPVGATSTNSSVFVYDSCTNVGVSCIAGLANALTTARVLTLDVTAGSVYTIVISSGPATQTVAYNLLIQKQNCLPAPTAFTTPVGVGVSAFTIDSATLVWTNTGNTFTSWDVAVQLEGQPIPSGMGTDTVTTATPGATQEFLKTGLLAATSYQYWVRAECTPGSGIYTAWAGPFLFHTERCLPENACTYTFRLTDSANNGWNNARMQVRQNGILVGDPLGVGFTSGGGPVNVTLQLCNDIPFDVFWTVEGTKPQECILTILNSFGQTIYTKPAGTGTPGSVVFTDTVKCDAPLCNIAPNSVTVTDITTSGATISWDAPSTDSWDIYVYPAGEAAPTASTVPTYENVTTNGFATTIPLLADAGYNVCVRVNCPSGDSPWTCASFTTLPTCPKPTNLLVEDITTTSATLKWTPGTPTDNSWEILLIPSIDLPPAPPINPDLSSGALLLPTTNPSPYIADLQPATIYYYYIRTVCPGDDKSTWTGPIKFNTTTCEPADKCAYKFILTDTGTNGWAGARMQVRQNGIIIQTLGQSITGGGPTTVSVLLCNNVPFDLFWSIEGTAPEEIGIKIQNPFTDIIYTKEPNSGTPLTVLFSDTTLGNCTPPTCPKPTALAVAAEGLGQTQVKLSWTESGSATQWEVYVVPVGSPLPVNNTPLNTGIANYYLANTNFEFPVTGLLPGTAYVYYVRAICSVSDISTWTILNPKTFTTKPVNDECEFSTVVPVNPTRVCTDSVNGSTLGATRSLPNTAPVCPGNSDDDVWYSFVATAATHIITFSNIEGTTTDINHTLYHQGADCTTMTQLYCSNPNISIAVDLVIGDVYKIRAYTNGGNAAQSAKFNLCITTPEPVVNDECSVATNATVNTSVECLVLTHGSLTGATPSSQTSSCAGTEDDDVWFKFVANSTIQLLSLINVEGTTDDLEHSLYSGNCDGGMTLLYCSGPNESTANNLVVGQTYYIRVWSNSNIRQDVVFDLCIGKILPPIKVSTNVYSKQQLIEDILLDTTCANVSNITFSTGTNYNSTNGIGYFNKDLSEFPFADGIALTTGNVLSAPGPNTSDLSDGQATWLGDTDLEAVLTAANVVYDHTENASKLEFDFIPLSSPISFNYLFAAEEYGVFQCGFSDAFAFILTNTVTNESHNLAVLPDGSPVSVKTVRDSANNDTCDSVNPQYFGSYYGTFNGSGINPLGAPINFNGYTVPLTAVSPVTPGVKYHIKLVIADADDSSFDSAVFLEGGSFNIGNVDLGTDFLEANGTAICQGDSVTINSGLNPASYDITWLKDGNLIENEHNPILIVTSPGVYTVSAAYTNTTCVATDNVIVEFFEDLPLGTPNNLAFCDASGSATFNFAENEALILAPFETGSHSISYFLTEQDAIDNNLANAITTPNAFLGTNGQTIYVRVNKLTTSCHQFTSFKLIVEDLTPRFTLTGKTEICPADSTTITVVPTDNDFNVDQVTYIWTYNGDVLPDAITKELVITGSQYGTYTVTVNNTGCTSTQTFEVVNSNNNWAVTFIDAPYTICQNQSVNIAFTGNNFEVGNPAALYTWTRPDGTQFQGAVLSADQVGDYTLEINILGCISLTTVNVGENTSSLIIDFASGCDSNVFVVKATPSDGSPDSTDTYTYSWTGPDFKTTDSPDKITIGAKGTYEVTITSADGCHTTESISLNDIGCDIQRGISPNNDGKNDDFDLTTLNVRHISIFNRYGTEVYGFGNYTKEWHGQSSGGDTLPDGTYFYVIEQGDGQNKTGWIYINR